MEKGALLRKVVHVSAPAFLIYYYLPDPLWDGGPEKQVALLFVFISALVFELLRLALGFKVMGMRWYEKDQISAGAWAAIGITFAFLFFPIEYAAPALIGMAWIDPLIGVLRSKKSRMNPWLPLLLYFLLATTVLSIFLGLTWRTVIASIAGAIVAIIAEGVKTRYVDDDFLMLAAPLITFALILGSTRP